MRKSKITDKQWDAARRKWESDPACSYAKVADFLGVSKALIVKRAQAFAWQKFNVQTEQAESPAPMRDSKVSYLPGQRPGQAPEVTAGQSSDGGVERPAAVPVPVLPDEITEVTERHTKEWRAFRAKLFAIGRPSNPSALVDLDQARAVKILMEALRIQQQGELDSLQNGKRPPTIVINRRPGKTIDD